MVRARGAQALSLALLSLVASCSEASSPSSSPGSNAGDAGQASTDAGSGGSARGGAANSAGSTSGGSGGGSGSSGSGAAPSCSDANDPCPMPSGIKYGCKQRFALGINYAWRNFAVDFGGLAAWNIKGVKGASEAYAADLVAMKASGASVIRWWMFPDFRGDGVTFDDAGDPTGLSAAAKDDILEALRLAEEADVYVVPTLLSFDGFRPTATTEGITVRGISALVSSKERRGKLIENVIRPIAMTAAASPHVGRLIGWDIINEPEWAIEQSGQNPQDFGPNPELEAVSLADMKSLISEAASVLKNQTPAAFTSVGWAAAKWSWAFADLDLDVNQPHIYGWVNEYWPYTKSPAELGYPGPRPTIMGEFSLQAMPFEDEANTTFDQVLESWWTNGYAGAWPWQHFDQSANLPLLKAFAERKGCEAAF